MSRYRAFAALLCAAALTSCDYEKIAVQDIHVPAPGAQVKFFNFGLNAPGVNFYANDTKVTGILTATGTEATTGVGFGGVASAGLYSGLAPGQYTLSGRIAATTDKDLAISEAATTLETGKRYSFYQSGPYNTTTKKVDAFMVEDPFAEEINWSSATVRFVNAIHNANPMTLLITNVETGQVLTIGGAVAYKSAGAFTVVPEGIYNVATRYTGVSTNAITRTAVTFSASRVYTVSSRGDITVTSTTAATRPFLDVTVNR
ncbi:MAG: DUF4397 domain-containing protein [Gemmatimonadaceae bacterium]|jgi:hypothetical protein